MTAPLGKRSILDGAISPAAAVEALAARGIKISERTLREKARRIGAYRELGQAMFFLPEDLMKIMEPERAPVKSRGRKPVAPALKQPRPPSKPVPTRAIAPVRLLNDKGGNGRG